MLHLGPTNELLIIASSESNNIDRFNGFIGLNNNRKTVELVKLTVEEREENIKNSKERLLNNELDDLIGFRKVIDAISENKAPIVGHNMFLDLLYFYHNFYKSLPESFDEFTMNVQKIFPSIFDSKYASSQSVKLANSTGYLNTGLQDLFEKLQNELPNSPRVMLGREFEIEQGTTYHEAGFDAYCTGVCFLKTLVADDYGDPALQIDFEKASTLKNKIYLMNSTFPFLSLDNNNEAPDYSNIFKITDFPKEWSTSDIQNNLRDLGSFFVKWINDESCLIILKDRNCIPLALEKCNRKVKKMHKFVISPVIAEEGSKKRKRDETVDDLHPSKKNQCCIQ